MPIPIDEELYEQVKNRIYAIYSKPSAYRSGAVVKEYKLLGGRYRDDGKPKNLKRWFKEDWKDVAETIGMPKAYPTYRPSKRVSSKTPTTINEIPISRLQEQYKLKQVYRGERNLPSFLNA